jgi:multidrug efflux system outer membrane protein
LPARVLARGSVTGLLPELDVNSSFERRRTSGTLQPTRDDIVSQGGNFSGVTRNTIRLGLDSLWELDLWGRVRRSIEATRADAEASAALFHAVRLSLQADLAQNYFALRSVQAEIDVLESTVALRRNALRLVRNRFEGGATNDLDVARTEAEVASAESDVIALRRRAAELVNAIATQTGQPASSFRLTAQPLRGDPPRVPPGIPSDLLERRPDIAEQERRMAAASARIGVARAAFFPSVQLAGRFGVESAERSLLFEPESLAWAFGPAVNLPIFEQLANWTVHETRKLQFEESVATYRERVLAAIEEVENSLSNMRLLDEQRAAQSRAVTAAERTLELSKTRYEAGLVSYLEVVDSERTRLQSLRLARQIEGQRFLSAIQLIKTLGGGWDEKL